jgi:hypothetical protein
MLGRLTVASSSLDHILRHLGTIATRTPEPMTAHRDQAAEMLRRACLHERVVVEWTNETTNLLGRRDKIVHALWMHDESGALIGLHGGRGSGARSESVPDYAKLTTLVNRTRSHLAGDKWWDVLVAAKVGGGRAAAST